MSDVKNIFNVNDFKIRLKNARESIAMNQEAFAKAIDIARASASYYENTKNSSLPNVEVLSRMCDVLGVSYDYLLNGTECKKADNQEINKRLGLSDVAIEILEQSSRRDIEMVNSFICNVI